MTKIQTDSEKTIPTNRNIAESRNLQPSIETGAVTDASEYDEANYDDYDEKASPANKGTSVDGFVKVDTTTSVTVLNFFAKFIHSEFTFQIFFLHIFRAFKLFHQQHPRHYQRLKKLPKPISPNQNPTIIRQ